MFFSVRASAPHLLFFFFFNDTATTEIYTLSLHDALPISPARVNVSFASSPPRVAICERAVSVPVRRRLTARSRSEEHTSELQSQSNLVCRLLLEKKKKKHHTSTPTPLTRPARR